MRADPSTLYKFKHYYYVVAFHFPSAEPDSTCGTRGWLTTGTTRKPHLNLTINHPRKIGAYTEFSIYRTYLRDV